MDGDPAEYRDALAAGSVRGRGAGIAPGNRFERVRLHVLGEHLDEIAVEHPDGVQVPTRVYRDRSRTVINPVNSPDLRMRWTFNPYRGCEHGCIYCYARPGHEYLGWSSGLDFETRILAKTDAPALLRKELARASWHGESISVSGVTDPYQPIEAKLRITRACMEVFAEFAQPVGIVTKSRLVVRDLDVLQELAGHRAAAVAVSLTTLDPRLARSMEPRASSPAERLKAIAALSAAGIPVTVMTAPVIPGLNDHEVPALLEAAAAAGAQSAGYVMLRLPYQIKGIFLDWLRREFPEKAAKVEGAIRGVRGGGAESVRLRRAHARHRAAGETTRRRLPPLRQAPPPRPPELVPLGRRVPAAARGAARWEWGGLGGGWGWATGPVRPLTPPYTWPSQDGGVPMAGRSHSGSTRYLSHELADWACRLEYSDLSKEAVERAKLFWFDSLGCALGGSEQDDAGVLLAHYREMSGAGGARRAGSRATSARGPCTCFVSGFRTNPADAAFLNAHMIRAMDYNDIYWKADPCHPSDIIAGPLALAEMLGLAGKDLLLATVIAYEVEMRLCEFGVPGIREYGWHHATLTAFAAPIAAGRVLGLTPGQMVQAIGISASRTFTPGAVTAGKLTNMKNTVDPWAARMGVESALLARRGFSGPEHIIDGKEGLFAVFGHVHYQGAPARFDAGVLAGSLPRSRRDRWRILDCGMKSFPIEALSHAPLTAMMKCVRENGIRAGEVAEIKVEVIARAADILGDPHKYRPDSKETADHSLPYCLAVGLVDGMVTPLQFKEERVGDKRLIPVMDKVKVVANGEFEALFPKFQPSRVTITTTGGKQYSTRVDVPKGDPRDPMTGDEIAVKFNALGAGVVGEARCRELRRAIMGMDALPTLAPLMRLMTAPAPTPRARTAAKPKRKAPKRTQGIIRA